MAAMSQRPHPVRIRAYGQERMHGPGALAGRTLTATDSGPPAPPVTSDHADARTCKCDLGPPKLR